MYVALQVPSRLRPPRSWPKWRLLGSVSLVVLSVYRLEYAYVALVLHSTFMTIYIGTLSLVLLIPAVARSALVRPATTTYHPQRSQNLRHRLQYVSISF